MVGKLVAPVRRDAQHFFFRKLLKHLYHSIAYSFSCAIGNFYSKEIARFTIYLHQKACASALSSHSIALSMAQFCSFICCRRTLRYGIYDVNRALLIFLTVFLARLSFPPQVKRISVTFTQILARLFVQQSVVKCAIDCGIAEAEVVVLQS